MTVRCRLGHAAAASVPALALALLGLSTSAAPAQMATAERLEAPGFWPTRPAVSRDEYVGPQACAGCHASKAMPQQTTAMARTFAAAARSDILRGRPSLAFRAVGLEFALERRGDVTEYTVRDGRGSMSATLGWAFGAGKVGQTYLFEHDGQLREARVSFFGSTGALDFTPARALDTPVTLPEAMGRIVPPREALRCFGCHTTASNVRGQLALETLIPGVTCEACHGPGRAHVEAMARPADLRPAGTTLNPQRLSAADSVDFCGACHATYWDVMLSGDRGPAALRSQPYRLQTSACWGEGDSRLTCVACHDPHAPLETDARQYDASCVSCHAQGVAGAAAREAPHSCRTAGACVSCHMPRYRLADMHASFTDHRIQIAPPAR